MADTAATRAPPPMDLQVGNLEVNRDNKLTWTGASPCDEVGIDTIVVILKQAGKDRGFVTCCLKESGAKDEKPFELLILRSDFVPAGLFQQHQPNRTTPLLAHVRGEDMATQVDIIVSTNSGTHQALPFWQTVLHPLRKVVHDELGILSDTATTLTEQGNVHITQNEDSVSHFARSLWSSSPEPRHGASKSQTVILLSGDGGVVDLLNGRPKDSYDARHPMVALLPLGTGNALFHSLHRPVYASSKASPLVVGLRTLLQGARASLPTFRASFSDGSHIVPPGGVDGPKSGDSRYVSHLDGAIVASYGFHASLVYESDTPAWRKHGDKRFGLVAQDLLRESHPYTADVEVRRPGASFEQLPREEHAYVLTTMVSNLERTFMISPASQPLDGQLRTVHFGNIGGQRAMEAMTKAYDGGKHVDVKWDDGEKIHYEEVDEIRITLQDEDGRWRKICVDGTIVEIPKGGQISLKKLDHSPLDVLVHPMVLDQDVAVETRTAHETTG